VEVTGANIEVVQLFAVFHDSQRITEQGDPVHGICGARFAARLRGKLFDLSDDDFDLLFVACAGHTDHPTDDDPTIQTCWDADRLDVGRIGTTIDPLWISEAIVDEHPKIIEWADWRAKAHVIPELIHRDWGIPTDRWQEMAGLGKSAAKLVEVREPIATTHPQRDLQAGALGVGENGRTPMPEPKIAAKCSAKVHLHTGEHWWCACGESQSQPFCDGSHRGTSFTPLKIIIDEPQEVSLCACKRTQTSPYCDGTHKRLG
jgi:uncharacterized protein